MKKLSDKILDLTDARDDMTRSDLQGCVDALVSDYARKIEEINRHLHEAQGLLILRAPKGIDPGFWDNCTSELEQATYKARMLAE
jgi:hypothetical protein